MSLMSPAEKRSKTMQDSATANFFANGNKFLISPEGQKQKQKQKLNQNFRNRGSLILFPGQKV